VTDTPAPLPTDLAAAHAMILAERSSARLAAEARAEEVLAARLEIERLKLEIARLRREKYGPSSERAARIEQLELSLEALEETAAEADAATETQEPETPVRAFTRRKPARRPLPEHLPRKRIVYPVPTSCACCGGELRKLGEDVTETLERVPASWFAGGRRAAAMYTLIETCKLNDVDPRAWLADVLARLPQHPASRIGELLPWSWQEPHTAAAAA
jgi:transposase